MSLEFLDTIELPDTMRELTVKELDQVSGGKCICGCGMDKTCPGGKKPSPGHPQLTALDNGRVLKSANFASAARRQHQERF
jgi:bacteriocin-like protein